jgi:acyl-CoA thioesterase-1
VRKGHFIWGICLIVLSLPFGGCRGETAPTLTPTPLSEQPAYQGTIVAFGNSLTEGLGVTPDQAYPAYLERKLISEGYPYQVINAGVGGETSSGALSRIDWILNLKPDIVILETGGNDGLRGIEPALTKENISQLVGRFQESDIEVVLAGLQIVQNLGQEYTTAFKEIYPAVAEEHGVILVPFFLERVAGEPELNQADGIHPTPAGYEIIAETVYPYVIEAIEKRRR